MNTLSDRLQRALEQGNLSYVETLLELGADINGLSSIGSGPPLSVAAYWGHINLVKFLLAKGANVNGKNGFCQTALYFAAWGGHNRIVELLLSIEGIDVNARDNDGETALDHAANEDIRRMLIEHGATH